MSDEQLAMLRLLVSALFLFTLQRYYAIAPFPNPDALLPLKSVNNHRKTSFSYLYGLRGAYLLFVRSIYIVWQEWLLIAHYSLLIAHYSLLIAHCSLLIAHYSLLIAHCFAHCFAHCTCATPPHRHTAT